MKNVKIKIFIMALLLTISYKAYSQTELYKQYEHRTEFTVMCIMQYPITDSVKTDLTLFVPHDKEGIMPILKEFNIDIDADEIYRCYGVKNGGLFRVNVCKDDVTKRYGEIKAEEDYKNVSKLVYGFYSGILMVIHDIDTEKRDRIISKFLTKSLRKPEILPEVQENK